MGERDLFYQEIRKNMQQAREGIVEHEQWMGMLCHGALAVLWLSGLARTEGLLALEEAKESERIAGLTLGAELARMIGLVVDGTDPEVVWDICMKRYFSHGYSGVEGILYLAYMDGMLNVQSGMHPLIIQASVKAMMPAAVEEEIERLLEQGAAEKPAEEALEKRLEKLAEKTAGSPAAESAEKPSEQEARLHLKDFFKGMANVDIQKVLRKVSWGMLATAMQGWDIEMRKLICDNLSKSVREAILEKMQETECTPEEILYAQKEITKVVQRLEECGEIHIQV